MLCICNAKGILGSRIHKTDKFVSSEISTSTIHFHFCVWRVCLAAQKNHTVDWQKERHRFFFSAYENFGSKTHTTRNTRTHARAFAIRNGGLKKKTNASAFACRDWIRCHFVTSFVCMCESHGGLCTYAAFPKLLHIFFIIFHQSARHHFFFAAACCRARELFQRPIPSATCVMCVYARYDCTYVRSCQRHNSNDYYLMIATVFISENTFSYQIFCVRMQKRRETESLPYIISVLETVCWLDVEKRTGTERSRITNVHKYVHTTERI